MSGVFDVTATGEEVAAFRRAARLGTDGGDALPFTYPIRWLAAPEVRAAVMALVPEPDLVPFHESQSFDYAERPRVGARYALTVTTRRESRPDRLVVKGMITAADGAVQATVETVLRLFPVRADHAEP